MELVYGLGALLLLGALYYGVTQSRSRRERVGRKLPEEQVDEVAHRRTDVP